MKKTLILLSLILIPNLFFTFFIRPENSPYEYDYKFIKLNKHMGIIASLDAFDFIGAAIKPSYLLEPSYFRQSRPLYVLIGSALGYSVFYGTYPLHPLFNKILKKSVSLKNNDVEKEKGILYFCFYAGYVLFNILILLTSLYLFEKILKSFNYTWPNGQGLYLLMLFLLTANGETKYFLFTPHQQLFSILIPLLSIYISLTFNKLAKKFALLTFITFLSGIALLVYGNCLLLFGTIGFMYLYTELKKESSVLKKIAPDLIKLTLAFALPTIIWMAVLSLNHVTFYSAEMAQYRQLIWIIDGIKVSPFYLHTQLGINAYQFMQTFGVLFFPSSILIISVLFIFFQHGTIPYLQDENIRIPALISIIYLLFFLLLGFYADRLTFGLTPFLIYFTTYYLNKNKVGKLARVVLGVVIILQYLWIAIYDTPYLSTKTFYN